MESSHSLPRGKGCHSDIIQEAQMPSFFSDTDRRRGGTRRVLSLFSGCGGMDLGFEGGFIAPRKSFPDGDGNVVLAVNDDWVLLRKTGFTTVFANDIMLEAKMAWETYMKRFGNHKGIYHCGSIVDLVKMHNRGMEVFPRDIDVVTGGFPCQDFSLAGKRLGFQSMKDDVGNKRSCDKPSEESRGQLYSWMKQVIDITRPKVFVAENVKGLVNLGDAKDIIQRDFASSAGNGYIVLPPQVLHAGDYGVPETRERVIFIGIRRDALRTEALMALEAEEIAEGYNPYPKPTHACTRRDNTLLPTVSTIDVFKGLKEPDMSVDASQRVFSRAKYLDKGQGQTEIKLDGLGPTIRSEHHGNIEFRRLSAEHGGKYEEELSAGMKERRLTPRECALIQTFPPDYDFVIPNKISATGAYKVIGNAVPPVLAYHLATRLESLWTSYFG